MTETLFHLVIDSNSCIYFPKFQIFKNKVKQSPILTIFMWLEITLIIAVAVGTINRTKYCPWCRYNLSE